MNGDQFLHHQQQQQQQQQPPIFYPPPMGYYFMPPQMQMPMPMGVGGMMGMPYYPTPTPNSNGNRNVNSNNPPAVDPAIPAGSTANGPIITEVDDDDYENNASRHFPFNRTLDAMQLKTTVDTY